MKTQITSKEERRRFFEMLIPGDWVNFQYGTSRKDFYIIARSDGRFLVGNVRWLVSAADWIQEDELYSECPIPDGIDMHPLHKLAFQGPPIYLGRGKKKWWWKFLPWKDCICPFSKPSLV